jgi:glycosyltransferase involved in cell wall biosynthesis
MRSGATELSRSLLYLSYLFPPRGGAGVQRSLKFAKYLPDLGWRPLIVANGARASDGVTQMQDNTLLKDLPPDTVIRYTKDEAHLEQKWRRWLNPTDTSAWWVKSAIEASQELLQKHNPSAILVTMSPFTSAEAGIALKKQTNLPLILDLRDPWALDETKIYPTRYHAWRDLAAMSRALRSADLIIMNTPQAARDIKAAFNLPDSTRIISLTNGFDPDDFTQTTANVPPAAEDTLRIVHTGLFHAEWAQIWDDLLARRGAKNKFKHARRPINLWTRTPRYLLDAIAKVPAKIELILVGELTPADKSMLESSPLRSQIKILGYRSHEESVAWLKSADLLFLPLHTPLDGGPASIVPGKAYEYLGARRPILAMGPPGDMRNFIRECSAGLAIDGDDVNAAAEALADFYKAKRASDPLIQPDAQQIARFERSHLAEQLADELNQLVSAPATRPAVPLAASPLLQTQS